MHTPPAPWWVLGNVCVRLKEPGFQAVVVWHCAQPLLYAVPCEAGELWQEAHDFGVPANVLFLWHFPQAMPMWAPVSLKSALLWSNDAGSQALVV